MTETINVAQELKEIRGRIEARLSRTVPEIPELALPPIEPLRQARGAAEAWAHSLGGVNFRPPGVVNEVFQAGKKVVSRGLRFFTFPQTQFNSGIVAALVRVEEMFADMNRNMVVLGQNLADRRRREEALEQKVAELQGSNAELRRKVEESESNMSFLIALLRKQADELEARTSAAMEELRGNVRASLAEASHATEGSLAEVSRSVNLAFEEVRHDIGRVEKGVSAVQERFWEDLAVIQQKLDAELRLIRQRLLALGSSGTVAAPQESSPRAVAATAPAAFDYSHFENRFRGPEETIKKRQAFYLPILKDAAPVLDVACGRGEMLELLREQGIAARGVDLDSDMIERCKAKHLSVERADALTYLEAQPGNSLGAVFSAQFIEHLPATAYGKLIALAFSKLRPGGRLIFETQNPECLAIFSQSFYLDPTHVRPVPAAQVKFLMEEAGFRDIRVHYLSPSRDAGLPELPSLPGDKVWTDAAEKFNETYFRYMDYGIEATKPGV